MRFYHKMQEQRMQETFTTDLLYKMTSHTFVRLNITKPCTYMYIHECVTIVIQDVLLDSNGYQYTLRSEPTPRRTHTWRCCFRSTPTFCKGEVHCINGVYIPKDVEHICRDQVGMYICITAYRISYRGVIHGYLPLHCHAGKCAMYWV